MSDNEPMQYINDFSDDKPLRQVIVAGLYLGYARVDVDHPGFIAAQRYSSLIDTAHAMYGAEYAITTNSASALENAATAMREAGKHGDVTLDLPHYRGRRSHRWPSSDCALMPHEGFIDGRGIGGPSLWTVTTRPLREAFDAQAFDAESLHDGVFVGEHGDCRDAEAREAFDDEDDDLTDYVDTLYLVSLCNDPCRWRSCP